MHDLEHLWRTIAGSVLPIAHGLKFDLEQRWVRFHCLPDSKRYPDHDSEMFSIIDRHNEILSTVFTPDESLFIVRLIWPEDSSSEAMSKGYVHWREVMLDEDDPESIYHAYAKTAVWSAGCLDWAIEASANDELFGFMAVGSQSKTIYHPYDGGMDIIMPTPAERKELKGKYVHYLSNHPDGL